MILINLLSNQATTCKLCMKDGIYSICNSVRSLKYHINKTHKHSIEEYTFKYIKDEVAICPICGEKYIRGFSAQRRNKLQTCSKRECIHELLSNKSRKTAFGMSKESRKIAATNISKTKQKNKIERLSNIFAPRMLINLLFRCEKCGKNCSSLTSLKLHNTKAHERQEMVCKECQKVCYGTTALSKHYRKEHNIEKIDFVTKYFYDGVRPKCKCSCGKNTNLHGLKFRDFLTGHYAIMTDKTNSENFSKNGIIHESKVSTKFYEILKKYFVDIKRSYLIDRFFVDFYIRDIDTFIEFDGEYWHGKLNFEHLKDTYPRDYKCIKNRVLKDGQQNTYFKNRNLSLLRISDKEFLSCESDEEVFSKLACISGTNRLSGFFS